MKTPTITVKVGPVALCFAFGLVANLRRQAEREALDAAARPVCPGGCRP